MSLHQLLCLLVFASAENNTAVDISSWPCESVVEFLKVHSENVRNASLENPKLLHGLLTAHVHIMAAIMNQRRDCLTESLRLTIMLFIRNRLLKPNQNELDSLIDGLRNLPSDNNTVYYSHESDGRLSLLESLRISTFNEESPIELCLLQFAIRHLFVEGDVVVEIPSGPLAEHSVWLKKTGLVSAIPVDPSPGMNFVSNGLVSEDISPTTQVDWIWNFNPRYGQTLVNKVFPRKGIIGKNPTTIENEIFGLDLDMTELVRKKCQRNDIVIMKTVQN